MVQSGCLSSLTNGRGVRASCRRRPACRSMGKACCGGAQSTDWVSVTQDPMSVLILLVNLNLNLTFSSSQVLCFCPPRTPGKFSPLPTGSTLHSSLAEVLTASQTRSYLQAFGCCCSGWDSLSTALGLMWLFLLCSLTMRLSRLVAF